MLFLAKKFGCLFQSDVSDKITHRLVRKFLHLPIQMHSAYTNLLGNHFDAEIRITDIAVDYFHNTFHQFVIRRFRLKICNLIFLFLFAGIGIAQLFTTIDKILHCFSQDIHIKRFGDIGISSTVQSFDVIFCRRFCRKQNNRNRIDVRILPYLSAECESIHFRHHHMTDYKIRFFSQNHVVSLFAVYTFFLIEFGSQLLSYIFAYFFIIFYDKNIMICTACPFLFFYWYFRYQIVHYFRFFDYGLFYFVCVQMIFAERETDNKFAARAVGVVFSMDITMVQLYQRTGKMQSDTSTYIRIVNTIAYLVETSEDLLYLIFINGWTTVGNDYFGHIGCTD